jgi:YD repeat-containing protein
VREIAGTNDVATFHFGGSGRLERLAIRSTSGESDGEIRYAYDAAGRLSQESYIERGAPVWTNAYRYDCR